MNERTVLSVFKAVRSLNKRHALLRNPWSRIVLFFITSESLKKFNLELNMPSKVDQDFIGKLSTIKFI